jgi:protein TonB
MPIFRAVLALFVFASGSTLFAQVKDSSGAIQDEHRVYVAETIPYLSYNGKGISQFIMDNLKYPQKAIDQGIEAMVIVDFIVDTMGRVTNVVSKDNGNARIQDLVDEAIRVIKSSSGYWKPGYTNGKKVRMRMRIPITFKLE